MAGVTSQQADKFKQRGVVLGWLLVVTITGFLLGFGTIAQLVWQNTELKALKAQFDTGKIIDRENPPLSFDRAFAAVVKAQPGCRPTTAVYPGTDLSTPQHYTVLLFGAKGVSERMFRIALVEADTGKVADIRNLPPYLQAIQLAQRRSELPADYYAKRVQKVEDALDAWLDRVPGDDVSDDFDRLVTHVAKHRGEWLVFLHDAEVPPTNNHAEQMLRPAVITRKVGGCNKTLLGAVGIAKVSDLAFIDTPEPATCALMGAGLVALAGIWRRRTV